MMSIKTIAIDVQTGTIDLNSLEEKISENTAAVCIQNPSYLGTLEEKANQIGKLAKESGAEYVVYVDPISLGLLKPPVSYGATIVCGDFQPLGMHMQFGGGHGGFIASGEDPTYVSEYADMIYGLTDTIQSGEYGFGIVQFEKSSYGAREKANEFTGTGTVLWAITAGVYLALMGPAGMNEVGRTIIQKSHYAAEKINDLERAEVLFSSPFFKEFVVNFDKSNKSIADINKDLYKEKIVGGKDLSSDFPVLGRSALFCVTEVRTQEQIDKLVDVLKSSI